MLYVPRDRILVIRNIYHLHMHIQYLYICVYIYIHIYMYKVIMNFYKFILHFNLYNVMYGS